MKSPIHWAAPVLAVSTLFLAGCGAFGSKDNGGKAQPTASELAGTWTTPCQDADWLGFTQSTETYVFGAFDKTYDKTTTVYTDACQTAGVSLAERGDADTLGAAEGGVDAKNLNLTVLQATLTPLAPKLVDALNAASYCGVSNWQLNQSVDMMGKDCAGEHHDEGEVVFDIYHKDGNSLTFGQGNIWFGKADVTKRPAALDQKHSFQRQQ